MNIRQVPLDLVDRDPDQPRQFMDLKELESLKESIGRLGQLQPVIVYEEAGRFRTVDGHRRIEALRMRDAEHAFALVLSERPNDQTLLLTQLAANCLRVDLKPTEKAMAFVRLKEAKGWNNAQLAKAVSMSKATVTQILSFLNLPEEAKSMLDDGRLAQSTAYAIARADAATQQSMIDKAASGELKRDDAQRAVSRGRTPRRQTTARATFQLPLGEIVVKTSEKLAAREYVAVLQQGIKELRKAERQRLDVKTLEKVLADQVAATGE